MPRADKYIAALFPSGASKTAVRSRVLTQVEAAALSNGLQSDAADFYYSGWVTFLDALHGVEKGFYTWATVKLYYSVFYALRAALAHDDVCAFHVGASSYTVVAQAGSLPLSCTDRGTHGTVLRTFQRRNPGHALVSQQIDLEDAVDWLMHKREAANYARGRFSEPECSSELAQVARNGLRKTLNAYVADTSFSYVFDPDHAMVAYPLRALQLVGTVLAARGPATLDDDEKQFLKLRTRDASGGLAVLMSEMKRLKLLT